MNILSGITKPPNGANLKLIHTDRQTEKRRLEEVLNAQTVVSAVSVVRAKKGQNVLSKQ